MIRPPRRKVFWIGVVCLWRVWTAKILIFQCEETGFASDGEIGVNVSVYETESPSVRLDSWGTQQTHTVRALTLAARKSKTESRYH